MENRFNGNVYFVVSRLQITNIQTMEDIYLMEEAIMVPDRKNRRRTRTDLMNLPDFLFYQTTQFTKDGVRDLAARLEHHLEHENGRGVPITPLHEVHKHKHLKKWIWKLKQHC